MKTVLFLLAVFSIEIVTSVNSFGWYSRVAKKGGPKGYNTVNVMADCYGTSIYCEYPGKESCPFEAMRSCTLGSKVFTEEQEAVEYAKEQIKMGYSIGKRKMARGKTVEWNVTDKESVIKVMD